MGIPRWLAVPVLVLVIAAGFWRFHDLSRDPGVVSGSAGEWLDPGTYLYNSRAYALFDDWRPAQAFGFYVTPGYTFLAGMWLKLVGPTYGGAVLLSVLCGWIVIGCTAFCAEIAAANWFSPPLPRGIAAFAAITMLGLSYVFFVFQQIPKGDIESMAICSAAAALLFSLPTIASPLLLKLAAIAAGLCAGVAPLVKLHAGVFSFSVVLAWFAGRWVQDAKWKQIHRSANGAFIFGLALAGVFWGFWLWWMFDVHLGRELVFRITQLRYWFGFRDSAGSTFSLLNIFESSLLYRHPIETLLAIIGCARYIFLARRNWSLFLTLVWLAAGALLMATLVYAPLRYRALFAVPAIIVAAHFWTSLFAGRVEPLPQKFKTAATTIAAISLTVVIIFTIETRTGMVVPAVFRGVLFIAFSIALYLTLTALLNLRITRLSAMTMAAALIASEIPQWYSGERNRDHQYSRLAEDLLHGGARPVLSGEVGMQVALWTDLDSYDGWTAESRSHVTHFLIREKDYEALQDGLSGFRITRKYQFRGFPDTVLLMER